MVVQLFPALARFNAGSAIPVRNPTGIISRTSIRFTNEMGMLTTYIEFGI
jgi:hypothetical protein